MFVGVSYCVLGYVGCYDGTGGYYDSAGCSVGNRVLGGYKDVISVVTRLVALVLGLITTTTIIIVLLLLLLVPYLSPFFGFKDNIPAH